MHPVVIGKRQCGELGGTGERGARRLLPSTLVPRQILVGTVIAAPPLVGEDWDKLDAMQLRSTEHPIEAGEVDLIGLRIDSKAAFEGVEAHQRSRRQLAEEGDELLVGELTAAPTIGAPQGSKAVGVKAGDRGLLPRVRQMDTSCLDHGAI